MALSRLLEKQELAELIGKEQISLRIPIIILNESDELAAELGITQAQVLREFILEGRNFVMGEWKLATKKGKK